MKIQRVETLSFAVSKSAEKAAELKALDESPLGSLKRAINRENVKLNKSYRPCARLRISRQEEEHKGIIATETIYKIRDNFMYVDLSTADMYHSPARINQYSTRVDTYDLLRKIIDLPDMAIKTLGDLMRTNWIFYDELDMHSVLELERIALIKTFKPSLKVILSTLWKEFNPTDDEILVKRRVKFNCDFPQFRDDGWDLSQYLKETNTLVEEYDKDKIKYSIDKISEVLGLLFNAKVELEGITFMPYLQGVREKSEQHMKIKPEIHFPVCRNGTPNSDLIGGAPLKPVAIGTAIGSKGTVPVESSTINFSDVANLEGIKQEILQAIVYPLTKPELAKEFGKKGGGAILLYGPPGCGKTYMAKATVGECGVVFFNVNISDIISKGVDEGAKSLHAVFEEARRNSPAIIFFDEIDAIGGRRVKGRSYAEKMEIDQFLMEMDGVDSLGEDVLVMASTNVPWNIDPALRRSVRFTKQIFIPPPDHKTRKEILKIHSKKLPLGPGIDYDKLAELTESYSSSDLKAICDAASEKPWAEALESGEMRKISMDDFLAAIEKQKSSLIPWFKVAAKEIRASGEEDWFKSFADFILKYGGGVDEAIKPDLSFEDVGNLEDVKEEIRKNIVYPLMREDLAREFRKEAGSILLYGPPGCGKTYIVMAAAGECEASFFDVRITDIISSEEGRSEKNIKEVFERANKNTPAILFFDEIDALAIRRDLSLTGKERRIVDILLEELDNTKKNKELMVIAATNFPWVLDPSIKRAGRFSKKILVSRPDKQARYEIFRVHTRDIPVEEDVDLNELADLTEGYSSADLKEICAKAAEIPWKEALDGGVKRKVNRKDLSNAIQETSSSLPPWYAQAKKQIKENEAEQEYEKLAADIERFNMITADKADMKKLVEAKRMSLGKFLSNEEKERISELEAKIELTNKLISRAKYKFHKREIDEKACRILVGDYEKTLIDAEVELENLKAKK